MTRNVRFAFGWAFLALVFGLPATALAQSAYCNITDARCRTDGTADVTVTCSSDNTYGPVAIGCCSGRCTIDAPIRCGVESDADLRLYVDGREFGSKSYTCSPTEPCDRSCSCGAQCSNRCQLRDDLTATVNVSGNQAHTFRADVLHTWPRGGTTTVTVWQQTFNPQCRTSCSSCQVLRDGQCLSCQEAGYPYCCGGACSRNPCESGCRSNADCGACRVCSDGQCRTCQEAGYPYCCGGACSSRPCETYALIEVRGPRPWRPPWPTDPNRRQRTPLSFRVWDPAAGYVFEGDRDCIVSYRGRTVDRTPDVAACWSRPWAIPDFSENPLGIVRTHRLRLTGPRTVYVQTECGVEFNMVLNPVRAQATYPGGGASGVTFDPQRGFRVDLRPSACPESVHVCSDGTPCGPSCPPGSPPWVCRATCADGSTCEAACRWTIDLGSIYEYRQTQSWCYENTQLDKACRRPGDPASCVSTDQDAVDDWRVSSPWCWEQSFAPGALRAPPPRNIFHIAQPSRFAELNGTAETDRCLPVWTSGERPQTGPDPLRRPGRP